MFAVLGELGLRDAGIFVARCTVGIAHPFRSVFLGPVDRTIQGRLPISRRLHYPSARPVRSRVRNVVAHWTPAREPVMKGVGLLAWACPTCPNGTLVGQVSLDHPFSGHLLPAKFTCAIRALRVASRGVRGCPSVPSHGTRDSGSRPDPRGAADCEASAAYPHAMAIALRSHGLLIARKVGEPKQDSANRSCHYTNPNRNLSIPTLLGGTRSRHRKSSAPLVVHCMGVSHVSQWDHLWDSLEGPSFFRPSPFRQIRICDQGLARRLAWRARLSICPVSPGTRDSGSRPGPRGAAWPV